MTNLTQMTVTELKRYLSENRADDEKFSEGLAELLNRDPNLIMVQNLEVNYNSLAQAIQAIILCQ